MSKKLKDIGKVCPACHKSYSDFIEHLDDCEERNRSIDDLLDGDNIPY